MKSKKGFFILLAVFLVLVVCYLALKVWTEKAQEEEQAKESDELVERTFSGSLPGFLTAFLGNKKLSGKEAEELKKLIDEYRED